MRRIAAILASLALVSISARDVAVSCVQGVSVERPMTRTRATNEAPISNEHNRTRQRDVIQDAAEDRSDRAIEHRVWLLALRQQPRELGCERGLAAAQRRE